MEGRLLHIFRNTPFGRETLLQSMYFCRSLGISLSVYIPKTSKFLMYFEHEAVQVDLDDSYLTDPDSAKPHVEELLRAGGMRAEFLEDLKYTATDLPDIPTDFSFMCSPRVIADLSTKIALGKIGTRVRNILRAARFPVLIPGSVFKPWTSVTVMFGGSVNAVKSLRLGLKISRESGLPLDVVTMAGSQGRGEYEQVLEENGLTGAMTTEVRGWRVYEAGDFAANLYDIPHDALIVLGAYGHGLLRDMMFGSKMELVQSTMPNSMLIGGPNFELQDRKGPRVSTLGGEPER